MRASLDWLRRLTDLPADAAEVADRLTAAGFVVAAVETCGEDRVLDVEVTYNRPDLLGHVGIARELAAAFGKPLRLPVASLPQDRATRDAIPVSVEAGEVCPVYTGRVVRGVRVGPSPPWLVAALASCGVRPVNNVVDVTNYVLFETGQPLHAFDLAKLRGPAVVVRAGRGEMLTTIDGRKAVLGSEDLAICDSHGPVAIAGVMGGLETEVGARTTDVLLESAVFAPMSVRSSARRHQVRSEASHRFERFVDPSGVLPASDRAAALFVEVCGATGVGPAVSAGPGAPASRKSIELREERVARVLGVVVPADEAASILSSLGLEPGAAARKGTSVWTTPSWRPDLVAEIDLIEEIGRTIGFDRVPGRTTLHVRPPATDPIGRAERRIREVLTAQGLRECISAPFVAAGREDVALLVEEPGLTIVNPVRAEECFLRRSLVGPLLATARRNRERGTDRVRLFECAPAYVAGAGDGRTEEMHLVAALVTGQWAEAKGIAESVLSSLGLDHDLTWQRGCPSPLLAERSATLRDRSAVVGVVGEVSPAGLRLHGLPGPVSVLEFRADRLCAAARLAASYEPVSRFPAVERDIAWVVSDDVPWSRIEEVARAAARPLAQGVRFVSEFRGPQLGGGVRSVAFRIELRAQDRTLTGAEADACVRGVHGALASAVGGSLRS